MVAMRRFDICSRSLRLRSPRAAWANAAATRGDPELDALFAQLEAAPRRGRRRADRAGRSGRAGPIAARPRSTSCWSAPPPPKPRATPNWRARFLDQASDLAPDYAEPWNRRANLAYERRGLSRRHRRHPGNAEARAAPFRRAGGLGLIYEELGQQRAALEAFRAALAIHPHYEAALQGVRRLEPRVDGRDA